MRDNTLLTIAIIVSIGGILILFLLFNLNLISNSAEGFYLGDIEDKVVLKGEVSKVNVNPTASFITLKVDEYVPLVVFDEVNVQKGDFIEIQGSLDEYKGKKQVVVDKIVN